MSSNTSFLGLVPAPSLESRSGPLLATVDGVEAGIGARAAGSVTEDQVAGLGGVPADVSAVVLNVTTVDAKGPGYFTVFPSGSARPNAGRVNYVAGQTVANAVLAKIDEGGKVSI
jgi:hypothetical protein